MYGLRARPVLTTFTLIGSVRFILGKGISRGRLSAALRKTIQVRPFQMVRCLPGCDTSVAQYPVLKVHAWRLIRSDRAARQGDILPDRRGPGGGNLGVHISYTFYDSQLCLPVIKRGPRFRDPLLRLTIEIGFQSLRPTACDRTLQSRQVLHQPRRHPCP